MPKVTKQSVKSVKRPSRQGGILDEVTPVGDMPDTGMKVCLYGRSKTGKTTLACTFPKPLLLVGTEDGTKSVRSFAGVDFIRLGSTSQVDEIAATMADSNYKSVVLDTAGGLQDMILKEILGLDDLPVEKSWGMAGREQWQSCGVQSKERLRALLDLSDVGVNIIVIAHERNFNDEGGSDLIFPTVGAALTPSTAGWLNGACDYLCQTFLREQTTTKEVKVAGKPGALMTTRTGKVEYCLRIGPHPVYMTGFRRVHVDGEVMPDVLVNPDYGKIRKVIDQGG
jgi:hypothetical protein